MEQREQSMLYSLDPSGQAKHSHSQNRVLIHWLRETKRAFEIPIVGVQASGVWERGLTVVA
eukprot:scaffold8556_cov286-Pinguiococcus_pyrenoidosus.AAC.3